MPDSFHRLLQRQIRAHLQSPDSLGPGAMAFLHAVDAAYREFDSDRSMLERALDLSSQELLDANAHMRAMFRAFPDLFVSLDANDVIVDCQGVASSEPVLGIPSPLGKNLRDVPPCDARPLLLDAAARARRDRRVVSLECVCPSSRRDQPCEIRFVPLSGGKLLAVVRDIADRRIAEERLRFHAQMLEGVRESIVATDMDGIVRYWSRGAESLYGYSADETVGKPYRAFAGAIDPPDEESFRRLIQNKGFWRGEHRQKRRDGSVFWSSTFISLFSDEFGRPSGYIGMDQDVTERKLAEDALRSSEERFRHIAENAGEWIWEQDVDGVYTYSSPVVERILGYKPSELVGKLHFYDLFAPQVREQIVREAAGRTSRREPFWRLTIPVVHKDGRMVYVETTGVPILGPDGSLRGYRGTDTDVTQLKLAETAHEKLQLQLAQAQKMESVGRLAGGVAHDFNNMLQAILGHVEIALDQVPALSPLHADLLEIQSAAARSADLTRQLLAFARKQTVAPKVLDLNETIESMLKMLRRLIGENIVLVWKPGSNLGHVRMDPSQIDQILANLCVNARDAIGGVGSISIETGSVVFDDSFCADHPGANPGSYARIAVSDTGCGMDKETLSHVFEPFFTTKGVGQGTGLGLATVYGIVKQNNGFVSAYSEVGQGSTFQICLPLHRSEFVPAGASNPPAPEARGHETILLVEDEPSILAIARTMLERLGYRVLPAATPGEAIRLAESHPGQIHLLMTDVVMPEMNGRDLAKNILSIHPRLKRLFMSGYTADVIASHAIVDEGIHFIQKPFAKNDLSAKVRAALDAP